MKAKGMAWEKPTWEAGCLWAGQIEKRQDIIARNKVEEPERPEYWSVSKVQWEITGRL